MKLFEKQIFANMYFETMQYSLQRISVIIFRQQLIPCSERLRSGKDWKDEKYEENSRSIISLHFFSLALAGATKNCRRVKRCRSRFSPSSFTYTFSFVSDSLKIHCALYVDGIRQYWISRASSAFNVSHVYRDLEK